MARRTIPGLDITWRQMAGIFRLHVVEQYANFRSTRLRYQVIGGFALFFLMGLSLIPLAVDTFYPPSMAGFDYQALSRFVLWCCLAHSSLCLLITPYNLFAKAQLDEMVAVARLPIGNAGLALIKYLDLSGAFGIWYFVVISPSVSALCQHAPGATAVLEILFHLGSFVILLHLIECLALVLTTTGGALTAVLPRGYVRPVVIFAVFNGLPLAGLAALFPLADQYFANTRSSFLQPLFLGGTLRAGAVFCGLVLTGAAAWWLTLRLVGRLHGANIHVILDRVVNRSLRRASTAAGIRFALPLIPRTVQAVCHKDLRLSTRSVEFWLFLALALIPFLIIAAIEAVSGRSSLLEQGFPASMVFLPAMYLMLNIGLWQFKYEGEECHNLAMAPVPAPHVVHGKALALFIILLPVLSLFLCVQTQWFATWALCKLLFILCQVYCCCVATVVISGATVNNAARNLMESVSWTARLLLLGVFAGAQLLFWLLLFLAELQPAFHLVGAALFAGGAWAAARLSPHFIKGLHGLPPGCSHISGGMGSLYAGTGSRGEWGFAPRLFRALTVGSCAAVPLFLAYVYVLGGARNFWDFPVGWLLFYLLLPPALGLLVFCPGFSRHFRIVVSMIALSALVVLSVNRFDLSGGRWSDAPGMLLTYPGKLWAFVSSKPPDTEQSLLNKSLPPSFTAVHKLKDGTSLRQLLESKEKLSCDETYDLVVWLDQFSREDRSCPYDANTLMVLLSSKSSIDFGRLLRWLSDRKVEENHPCKRLLEHYLRKAGPGEDDAIESALSQGLLNRNNAAVFQVFDCQKLDEARQPRIARAIKPNYAKGAKPKTCGTTSYNKTRKPTQDSSRVVIFNWMGSGVDYSLNVYNDILRRLLCVESFSLLQDYVLLNLPSDIRWAFPSTELLVQPSEMPTAETLAKYYRDFPAYFRFIGEFHPVFLRKDAMDEFLMPLDIDTLSSSDFIDVVAGLQKPELSAAYVRRMGFEWFEGKAREYCVERVIGSATCVDATLLDKVLASNMICSKHKGRLVDAMFSLSNNHLNVGEVLGSFDRQPNCYALDLIWRYLIRGVDDKQMAEAVLKLVGNGVPFDKCLYYWSCSAPLVKQIFSRIIDEDIRIKLSEADQFAYYRIISADGDHELAEKYLGYLRDKQGNESASKLLFLLRGGLISRSDLFDKLQLCGARFDCHCLRLASKSKVDRASYVAIEPGEVEWENGERLDTSEVLRQAGAWNSLCAYPLYLSLLFLVPAVAVGTLRRRPVLFTEESEGATDGRKGGRLSTSGGERPLSGWAAVGLLVFSLVLQAAGGVLCAVFGVNPADAVMLTTINVVSLGAALLLGVKLSRTAWRDAVPVSSFDMRFLLPLIPLLFGGVVVFSEIDNLLRVLCPPPEIFTAPFTQLASQGLTALIVLSACAPLTEEPLFRGLLLRSFMGRYGTIQAVLLSSFLFAASHLNPYQFVSAFCLGVLFAWLTLRTGSILPAMIGHAFYNSQGIVLLEILKLVMPGFNAAQAGSHQFQPWWFDAVGVACVVGGLLWLGFCRGKRYSWRSSGNYTRENFHG